MLEKCFWGQSVTFKIQKANLFCLQGLVLCLLAVKGTLIYYEIEFTKIYIYFIWNF